MSSVVDRTYLALFRQYPPLLRLAVITGAGQIAFALLNVYALPVYILGDLHFTGEALGAVSATFLLTETALKFPFGRFSDRLGRKPFIVLGPLLICLNPTVFAQLPARLWTLIFPLRALDGAGAAALWPPLFAMVGDLVRERSRAAAMSVINTIYAGAMGAAIALGALSVYITHTNRSPFYLVTGLLVIGSATAHFGIPKSAGSDHDPSGAPIASDLADPDPSRTNYSLPLVLLLSILMTLGVLMLSNFLVVYVTKELVQPLVDSGRLAAGTKLGLTSLYTGLLIGVLGIPVLLLGMPLGHAADRWGKSRAVRLSLTISAAVMWLIPSCRSIPAFAVVAVILALSHILGTPAWLALVSGLAPRTRRGSVMGIVATAEGIGAVIAPLIGGWLWDIKPAYIFYGSAALLSVAAVVAMHALRKQDD